MGNYICCEPYRGYHDARAENAQRGRKNTFLAIRLII